MDFFEEEFRKEKEFNKTDWVACDYIRGFLNALYQNAHGLCAIGSRTMKG